MTKTADATLDAAPAIEAVRHGVMPMIGGGEMGRRVRETDWSASALGAYETWPQSLRSSLSLVLNAKGIAALYWGPEQWLLYNDAYGAALGDRHPLAFSRPMPEVLTDIAPVLGPQVAEVLRTGAGFAIENLAMTMRRHDRDELTAWTYSFSPVQGEDGGFAGVLLLATEVTEQARIGIRRDALIALGNVFRDVENADELAAGANAILGRALGVSRVGYGTIDPESEVLRVRREWNAPGIEGLAPDIHLRSYGSYVEDLKRGDTNVIPDARLDPRTVDAADQLKALSGQAFVNVPLVEQGRLVALLYVNDVHARAWPEEDLDLIREFAMRLRIAVERASAAQALRDSEALSRENVQRVQLALSAGAIIGTWLWDLPSDRFTVDEAFAKAFGLDPALGRDGLSLAQVVSTVHPDDQEALAAAIGEAITRGGAYAHQYRTRRADGNYYWLEANGRVEHGPDGTPLNFPGVLIDIEERRAIEAERERVTEMLRSLTETLEQRVADKTAELMLSEEALRQSQKMEAVGQLTGGLAHDFNNLLAGISGSLDMMQTRIAQGRFGEIDRYMTAAQSAAKRAAALTHRLLAFSRRQTLEPKPSDVDRIVAGMEEMVRRTVGPAIAVEVHGTAGLWPVLVDPNQLENALLNLCINARDAMPHGGRLVLETANRTIAERAALVRDMPPGDYASLTVSDNGVGMAPEIMERVFEPFFTTKPIGLGTGLGLSMIYGFAKQSGGEVRLHSQVGEGTSVTIFLPRHAVAEADARVPEPEPASPRTGAGETVLVIDDEPLVRMLVVDVLEDLGYSAIEAADGPEGLEILRSGIGVDLLVTDVGLPKGMNGRQVADAARALRPGLKVLFVTGYAETAVLSHGHLESGMQVVTKPFDLTVLARRIKDLINS
ncbi:ATP-binding protein [Aureimonas sp. AU40]|uniref:ATP-binding protein n=1 Tax=Aureimonas sp. AU40 TaxID=1637747 RepID=UPI000AAF9477|nr:ATP-binding protein [Aureimonas sp. AU40]